VTRDATPAQLTQRRLYTSLGYVTGFSGYLNTLLEVVKGVEHGTRVDSTQLCTAVIRLKMELADIEAAIRVSMKEIPK